jgi:hypothetical protein
MNMSKKIIIPKAASTTSSTYKPATINKISKETKNHILYIVGAALIMKAVTIFITVFMCRTFLDTYGMDDYYVTAMNAFSGNLPYIHHQYIYPILLFVPVLIAMIPALLLSHNEGIYFITLPILMFFCDCITAACVYLITKKIYGSAKSACVAAAVYVLSISVAYFVMVEYSPFPTCLLMLALTTTIYGKEITGIIPKWLCGYYAIAWGYLAKIFPVIALPFIIFYNSKTTSIKEEIISAAKIFIPLLAIFVLPCVILNPTTIKTYIPVGLERNYFPNTILWTVHAWLHDVFMINITIDTVLIGMYAIMFGCLITLLYIAYKNSNQNATDLIKYVLCAIVIFVLCSKTRSPQYIVWYAPLLCILIVKDIRKIVLYLIIQVIAFIEFPYLFWKLWTNASYVAPPGSPGWYGALIFFTIEFSLTIALVWWIADPLKMIRETLNKKGV